MNSSLIGKKLGHFFISEQIGAGGMGVVYRAQDEHLGRDVAIKVLSDGIFSGDDSRARFRKEARALSRLNHPNIETVHDFGTQDGIDFLVLEYIPGITLADKLAKGPLREKEIQDLGIQLLDGLNAAHQQRILHRDLKPNNIRITPEGRLKILDFGLAKLMPQAVDIATTESYQSASNPIGTLPYMSPEQLCGENPTVAVDIYGCGGILYEMATGRRPFPQMQPALLIDAILHQEPPSPTTINRNIAAGLEAIILKALDKNPERRYSSARELQVDLQRLTMPLISAAASGRSVSFLQRKRRLKLLGTMLVLTAVLAIVVWELRKPVLMRYASPALPAQKHLAVLPFTNIGGLQSNQIFCDGLVETLTSSLTQLERFHGTLWVVPASEVRSQKIATVNDARKELAITLAITGSIQRQGDLIRLTANLVDATTLRQLQAITISTVTDDPALQDDLIQKIAGMMELELNPNAKATIRAGSSSIGEANNHYLRGQGYLIRHEKAENLDAAIASFDQALALDPQFALAYAGLAKANWQKYDLTKDPQWVDLALKYCNRAVQLNSRLVPVRIILGVIQTGTGKYEEAILEFERALALDRTNFQAYLGLANAYSAMDNPAKAEETYKRAIELRPDIWSGYNSLGSFYWTAARYEDAATMFEKVVALVPDSFRGYSNLGGIYLLQGRFTDAMEALEKSVSIRPSSDAYWNLAYIYYLLRRFSDSAAMYEKAAKISQPEHYWIWGGLGDANTRSTKLRDKAPAAYQRAILLAKQELKLNPRDANATVSLAYFYAKLGNQQECFENLNRALSLAPDSAEFAFFAAIIYDHFGQTETALDWLERAVRRNYSRAEIRSRIELDNLHDHPRFRALLNESNKYS